MGFEGNFLILSVVLALVLWTAGRKHEELRPRTSRAHRLAAYLGAVPGIGSLAAGALEAAGIDDPAGRGNAASDLRRIAMLDGTFDPGRFLDGARHVYEAVVLAYARGDRELLAGLLTADVYRTFVHAIALREARQHRVSLRFARLNGAAIEQADVIDGRVRIAVAFDSEVITVTRDAANTVVDGDPVAVVTIADRWTFVKGLRASGDWKLAATETPHGVVVDPHATKSVEACG